MKKLLGLSVVALCGALCSLPARGQETGSILGRVTLEDGSPLPGVLVEASSDVLPRARDTVSGANGDYRLPLLPPGLYELRFSLEGMAPLARRVQVRLEQTVRVDVTMDPETVEETIEVIGEAPLIDVSSAEIKTSIGGELIDNVPVGQQYRDLVKLIPGVQYTEDEVRGPSAGGSGQDNVYKFDGVNVGLPLFGTLSAEPSSHDIDEIAVVKGGAKAIDFNRSGGFTINSVSRSGTNDFRGEVSYQVQTEGMTGDRDTGSDEEFDEDRDWTVFNVGGPVVKENLFFYASYYRPTRTRSSRSNVYGSVPDFESERDELFGKLSFQPTDSILLHGSYRDSDRSNSTESVAELAAASTSQGSEAKLEIGIAEGSWVLGASNFLSFKYTDFSEVGATRPDRLFDFPIRADGSVRLDVANLENQGLFLVPLPGTGTPAYNAFVDSLIQRYGYLENGLRTGGGEVGGDSTIDDTGYFRESFEVAYDHFLGDAVTHELHVGYQWYRDEEDLSRTSNGWGVISVPRSQQLTPGGVPYLYEARFEQMSLQGAGGAVVPPIHSEFESQNIDFNDTIRWKNWTFNVGVLFSNDQLYGQGLRENSANLSGFELAPGNKYKMYELDFEDMIQPRLGVVWAYNGRDTAFANWSRYYPAASSLPRAASWDRNLRSSIRAFFDADGNLIEVEPVASSSGKFFQEDLDPRAIDEYIIGSSRRLSRNWTARAHARYRRAYNFWEDTNNNARLAFEPPPDVPAELYIPNLNDFREEIGGSSYVIAELDNAFTKYYEVSLEAEWRGEKAFVRGSYVWSHYYGNFDQDNTTTDNDQAIFIGSSFIADGAGRQIWDFRYGNLRGDRRNQLKLYGYYRLPWNASAGAFAVYQSGQPWETWNVEVYRHLTTSTSDVSRFAEPAGSRTTDDHYQLDLNYTQDFTLRGRFGIQLRADLFNVFDKQTGYNIQNLFNSGNFGQPRDFYAPRRLQLAVAFRF